MKSALWILNIFAAIALTTGCATQITSDTASQPTAEKVSTFSEFTTDYFTLKVPSDWQVIRAQGPQAPAFISLINTNANAAFNLRITRSTLSIDDLCQLAAYVFSLQLQNSSKMEGIVLLPAPPLREQRKNKKRARRK